MLASSLQACFHFNHYISASSPTRVYSNDDDAWRPATRPDREHKHKKNAKAKAQQKKDLLHLHGSIDRRIQSVSTTALWLQLLLPIKITGKNPINIILRNFDLEFV